jgi:hypothetical protein
MRVFFHEFCEKFVNECFDDFVFPPDAQQVTGCEMLTLTHAHCFTLPAPIDFNLSECVGAFELEPYCGSSACGAVDMCRKLLLTFTVSLVKLMIRAHII